MATSDSHVTTQNPCCISLPGIGLFQKLAPVSNSYQIVPKFELYQKVANKLKYPPSKDSSDLFSRTNAGYIYFFLEQIRERENMADDRVSFYTLGEAKI